jgi:hypothetical protein
MSIKIKTDKMKGKNYDYKEAYNKNLTAKARLHYLENARNDQDDSPVKQVGIVDPLTGQPVQQMTNVPPQQANTLGAAQPVFKPQAQQAAQGIYGGIEQRQNSVGASALFQRSYSKTSNNNEPDTHPDRLNTEGKTQDQVITEADKDTSVKGYNRSSFVRDSINQANTRIDKAIYNLNNPKKAMSVTYGKIKKI